MTTCTIKIQDFEKRYHTKSMLLFLDFSFVSWRNKRIKEKENKEKDKKKYNDS